MRPTPSLSMRARCAVGVRCKRWRSRRELRSGAHSSQPRKAVLTWPANETRRDNLRGNAAKSGATDGRPGAKNRKESSGSECTKIVSRSLDHGIGVRLGPDMDAGRVV